MQHSESVEQETKPLFRVTSFDVIPIEDGAPIVTTKSTIFGDRGDAVAFAAQQTQPCLILTPDAPRIGYLPPGYSLELARELYKRVWSTPETSPVAYVRGRSDDADVTEGQIVEALRLLGYKQAPPNSGIYAEGSGQVEPAYIPPKRKRPGVADDPPLASITARRVRSDKGRRRQSLESV